MIFALILILFIYCLLSFIIGKIVFKSLNKIKTMNKVIYWCIFSFFSLCFIIYELLKGFFPHLFNSILAYISSFYLSFFLYSLLFFTISFLITKVFKIKKDLYLASIIISIIITIIGTFLGTSPYIKKYDIKVEKPLNNGELKIAVVSDIHLGDLTGPSTVDKLSKEINDLDADILLIAGDLIDSNLNVVLDKNLLEKFKDIHTTYGTYFALGNHDFYTEQLNELTDEANANNIITLRDNYVLINNEFYIIGRDDSSAKNFNLTRKPLSSIIENIDKSKLTLLIDHTPMEIGEAEENNIDLQVSGHTHAGQVFPGNIITSSIFPLHYGYEKFDNTNVVVSSGFGTWGTLVRTNSRSQIILITLHN